MAIVYHRVMDKKITLDPDRKVGLESQKSYQTKLERGFFDRFLSGEAILDIGFAGHGGDGQPIVPQAIGIDKDFPGYDGIRLPFANESQDTIYSSHCFEHIEDYAGALREWHRVLKVGGYMIIVVPHQHLFEKRVGLPSAWNLDHKRFYTAASLLAEVESSLPPNSFRVRHLSDNDQGYDYSVPPLDAASGCFEIELVLEKIAQPHWDNEDGTSRFYRANEFTPANSTDWWLETDFSQKPGFWIWGPYVRLRKGLYSVTLVFEAIGLDNGQELAHPIKIDIGRDEIETEYAMVLEGGEGAAHLRQGRVTLEFYNDQADSRHEFRLQLGGPSFAGRLRFYGAELKYLGYTRMVAQEA
jgi:SAM-dependent methyltransferase